MLLKLSAYFNYRRHVGPLFEAIEATRLPAITPGPCTWAPTGRRPLSSGINPKHRARTPHGTHDDDRSIHMRYGT